MFDRSLLASGSGPLPRSLRTLPTKPDPLLGAVSLPARGFDIVARYARYELTRARAARSLSEPARSGARFAALSTSKVATGRLPLVVVASWHAIVPFLDHKLQ